MSEQYLQINIGSSSPPAPLSSSKNQQTFDIEDGTPNDQNQQKQQQQSISSSNQEENYFKLPPKSCSSSRQHIQNCEMKRHSISIQNNQRSKTSTPNHKNSCLSPDILSYREIKAVIKENTFNDMINTNTVGTFSPEMQKVLEGMKQKHLLLSPRTSSSNDQIIFQSITSCSPENKGQRRLSQVEMFQIKSHQIVQDLNNIQQQIRLDSALQKYSQSSNINNFNSNNNLQSCETLPQNLLSKERVKTPLKSQNQEGNTSESNQNKDCTSPQSLCKSQCSITSLKELNQICSINSNNSLSQAEGDNKEQQQQKIESQQQGKQQGNDLQLNNKANQEKQILVRQSQTESLTYQSNQKSDHVLEQSEENGTTPQFSLKNEMTQDEMPQQNIVASFAFEIEEEPQNDSPNKILENLSSIDIVRNNFREHQEKRTKKQLKEVNCDAQNALVNDEDESQNDINKENQITSATRGNQMNKKKNSKIQSTIQITHKKGKPSSHECNSPDLKDISPIQYQHPTTNHIFPKTVEISSNFLDLSHSEIKHNHESIASNNSSQDQQELQQQSKIEDQISIQSSQVPISCLEMIRNSIIGTIGLNIKKEVKKPKQEKESSKPTQSQGLNSFGSDIDLQQLIQEMQLKQEEVKRIQLQNQIIETRLELDNFSNQRSFLLHSIPNSPQINQQKNKLSLQQNQINYTHNIFSKKNQSPLQKSRNSFQYPSLLHLPKKNFQQTAAQRSNKISSPEILKNELSPTLMKQYSRSSSQVLLNNHQTKNIQATVNNKQYLSNKNFIKNNKLYCKTISENQRAKNQSPEPDLRDVKRNNSVNEFSKRDNSKSLKSRIYPDRKSTQLSAKQIEELSENKKQMRSIYYGKRENSHDYLKLNEERQNEYYHQEYKIKQDENSGTLIISEVYLNRLLNKLQKPPPSYLKPTISSSQLSSGSKRQQIKNF